MKLKVTQAKSTIRRKENQKRTIAALGLGRIGRSRIHEDNPVIRGMIDTVSHLVSVQEIEVKKPKGKDTAKEAKVADATKTQPEETERKEQEKPEEKSAIQDSGSTEAEDKEDKKDSDAE